MDPRTEGTGGAEVARAWREAVVRLLPIRVLVISSDGAYRAAIATLLTRRGMVAETAPAGRRAWKLVERERIDVVLLDLSAPIERDRMARLAYETLSAPRGTTAVAGLVLVGEIAKVGSEGGVVLDRWSPFEQLFDAIVAADRGRAPLRPPADGGTPRLSAL
jgi:CheY-like chemotaxis protein